MELASLLPRSSLSQEYIAILVLHGRRVPDRKDHLGFGTKITRRKPVEECPVYYQKLCLEGSPNQGQRLSSGVSPPDLSASRQAAQLLQLTSRPGTNSITRAIPPLAHVSYISTIRKTFKILNFAANLSHQLRDHARIPSECDFVTLAFFLSSSLFLSF